MINFFVGILFLIYSGLIMAGSSHIDFLGAKIPKEIILENTQEKTQLQGYAANFVGENPVYVGALFTSKTQKEVSMLLLENISMAMIFFFLQEDISSQKILRTFMEEILLNNPGWDNDPLNKERLKSLEEIFQKTINTGDRLSFEYGSNDILTVCVNGKAVKSFKNSRSFFDALLRIWIGPYPPSRTFKENILGKEA